MVDTKRNFLEAALAVGLDCGIISAGDVVRHVPPETLARSLPDELKGKLLAASLEAQAMNADLVLETVQVHGLCEHMPVHMLWACIAEAAHQVLGVTPESTDPASAKDSALARAKATVAKAKATTGAAASGAFSKRRPNASRRPERLKTTRMGEGETELGRWNERDITREGRAIGALDEWSEETATGDTHKR